MTTANVATVDKKARPTGETPHEKIAEKRRALGRGLESLLPGPRVIPPPPSNPLKDSGSAASAASDSHAVTGPAPVSASTPSPQLEPALSGRTADGELVYEIALQQIHNNPHQTRVTFDQRYLDELAQSIAVQGVMQPIVVRPGSQAGDFLLILGERRMRASLLAGKTTIPAIVKRVSEQQAAEMTLVENLQRQDLDCLEQAAAFSAMSQRFHLTQEEIGKRVGVSREQVSNYLRLLKLPKDVIGAIREKRLGYTHARALLRLESDEQICKMAAVAIEKKMSVAQLEDDVLRLIMPGQESAREHPSQAAAPIDPNVREAQRKLEIALGVRVRIRDRKGKGKITIEYGSLEDFDRVLTMLQGS
jgi:ParB family chromosome partitioning protein